MKITDEKVYRCDYCNKGMISKGAMTLHERMCSQNPKNRHACFKYCRYINKEKDDDGFSTFYCGNDKCNLYNEDLYSYKLERFYSNAERIKDMKRMPLSCKFYEIEGGHDDGFLT